MKRTILRVITCATLLFFFAQGAVQANIQPRIIGGDSVNINLFPSTIALISNSTFASKNSLFQAQTCGGTLISSTWVLTAAHCVVDNNGIVSPASEFSVLAGSTDLTAPVTSTIPVARVIVHEDYRQVVLGDDIALLQLSAASPAPAITMNTTKLSHDEDAYIVGWGTMVNLRQDGSGRFPRFLQSATVPIVDGSICSKLPGSYQFVDADNQICAGFRAGGVDSCSGDSGGPLYKVSKGHTLELAGITSWGNGCAIANQPGIYTDVAAYRSWIEKAMSDSLRPLETNSDNPRKPNGISATNSDIRSSYGGVGANFLFIPLLLLVWVRFKQLKTA